MGEQTITAALVITFCAQLEDGSAALYEDLSRRFPQHAEVFAGFANDCRKSKVLVQRTYQETVTDAIETGYAFDGLALGDPLFGVALTPGMSLAEALTTLQALECAASAWYIDIANRSQDLLATIPGAFRRAGRTRGIRLRALEALAR